MYPAELLCSGFPVQLGWKEQLPVLPGSPLDTERAGQDRNQKLWLPHFPCVQGVGAGLVPPALCFGVVVTAVGFLVAPWAPLVSAPHRKQGGSPI